MAWGGPTAAFLVLSVYWALTVQRELNDKLGGAGREVVGPVDVSVVTVRLHRQVPDLPTRGHYTGVKGQRVQGIWGS